MSIRLAALACLAPLTAFACPQEGPARAALAAGNLAAAEALFEPIMLAPDCTDAFRNELRARLAEMTFADAQKRQGPARLDRLDQALRYQKQWPILVAQGDARFAAKQYGPAAQSYQAAINRLNDAPKEGTASPAQIKRLFQMASAALALSDGAPEVPSQRDGSPGGIFAPNVRGYAVEEVDVPITFQFGRDEFDPQGAQLAEQLAAAILAENPPKLFIAGHTDPVGGEQANLDLSIKRAIRVANFLTERGYAGELDGGGFGESRPPELPDGVAPGSPEAHRLARRVEIQR